MWGRASCAAEAAAEAGAQTLESMAEKLPRELTENDLMTKIARSWASLIPTDRLGLAIEDNPARLAFLLLSSGICSVLLAVGVVVAHRLCLGAGGAVWRGCRA